MASDRRILHLYADVGVEDEVLHTFGDVVRVGIDPEPNPFSDVVQGDARDPPVAGGYDLAVAHPPCQRWSVATPGGGGDPEDHPDYIDDARRVCEQLADHYVIENVRDAPLHDPVHLTGGMFGMAIHYPRAFETSFPVRQPQRSARWRPSTGPLAEQGKHGNAWVGTNDGWRLAKGYGHDWPARGLKRHAVPAPYLRRLLYWWLAALDDDSPPAQATLAVTDGGDRSTDEFVRASDLRSDGGAPQARPEGYWDGLAENAPSADECDVCGADGESDAHDVRRVRTPQHDARVALCRSCRSIGGEDE